MKILFNCLTTKKGGAERVISILTKNLAKNNDIGLMTTMKTEDSYVFEKNIKRYSLDKKDYSNLKGITKLLIKLSPNRFIRMHRIIKKEKPDVIVSFLPEPSLRLMFAKKIFKDIKNIPVVISIRNDPNIEYSNKIIKKIMRFLYKNVDGMVLQTNKALEYFNNELPGQNKKIIIHNPLDDNFLKEPYKYDENSQTLISIGRLEPQKNHIMLINAFIDFCKKEKNKEYSLKIFGEGSLKEELQKYIIDSNYDDKIKLMGKTDDVIGELKKSRCFILSSNYEGMPNALIEALSLGIPCLATNVSGVEDLIIDNANGLIVNINDATDMSNKMSIIINEKHFVEDAKKYSYVIKKELNSDFITKQWLEFLKSITKER